MSEEDLRIKKTKLNIEHSFLNLLAKKEFDQITIKDITEQALIGKTTFYYHYQDKYDLAQKLISKSLVNYKKLLKQRVKSGLKEQFLEELHQNSQQILLLRKIRSAEINVDREIKASLANALEEQFSLMLSHLSARLLSGLVFEAVLAYDEGDLKQDNSSMSKSIKQLTLVFENISGTDLP